MLRKNARCFAVIAAGDFAGLITLTDIRKLEREEWATTSVYRAMTPTSKLHTVGPDQDMTAVMQLMAQHDVNQVPVIWGREIVGMLERADVMHFIQLRRESTNAPRTAPTARARPRAANAPTPDRRTTDGGRYLMLSR